MNCFKQPIYVDLMEVSSLYLYVLYVVGSLCSPEAGSSLSGYGSASREKQENTRQTLHVSQTCEELFRVTALKLSSTN